MTLHFVVVICTWWFRSRSNIGVMRAIRGPLHNYRCGGSSSSLSSLGYAVVERRTTTTTGIPSGSITVAIARTSSLMCICTCTGRGWRGRRISWCDFLFQRVGLLDHNRSPSFNSWGSWSLSGFLVEAAGIANDLAIDISSPQRRCCCATVSVDVRSSKQDIWRGTSIIGLISTQSGTPVQSRSWSWD